MKSSIRLKSLPNRIVIALCLVALSGALSDTDALAQKKGGGPPPPPPPPGTIYFGNWSTGLYGRMNGDGSSKTQSPGVVPSYQKHGGSRWFVQNRTVVDTGNQWFAVNEAGDAIQLTNDPSLSLWNGYHPSWAKDDSFFTICCVDETPLEWIGQLLVIPVAWIDGVPSAGPATTVLEIRRSVFDEWGEWSYAGHDEVSVAGHDWSPAENEVVLTRRIGGADFVLDIVRFTATVVESRQLATKAANPVWSPDGSRIAFNRFQHNLEDIWTIKPDGTAAVQLTMYIAGRNGAYGTGQYLPTWSPDGAYLAYTERRDSKNGDVNLSIRRILATGSSSTSLTSEDSSAWPRWRP